jgi:uncharacterized protein (DUF58 family)
VTVISSEGTSSPITITDSLGTTLVAVPVPGLSTGETHSATYEWMGATRGVHTIGPIVEERGDPFGLTTRSAVHGLVDQVLIHPVIHKLGGSPNVSALQQRTTPFRSVSDDPLSEFRTLRAYEVGDDPRLIHWKSSARGAGLVVRDFLDLRQNARVVLLDTADTSHTANEFEDAVEIAASLAVTFFESRLVSVAKTNDPLSPGRDQPIRNRNEILELFARVSHTRTADVLPERRALTGRSMNGPVFLVTGSRSQLLPRLLASQAVRSRLAVVRVGAGRSGGHLPVPHLDVTSSVDFARRWRMSA